ncbi:hypothetical protein D3C76_1145350 [compost metagenome]
MPAHVDDGIDVLDHHRALFHASTARGARPQGFGVDQAVDDGLVGVAAVFTNRLSRVRAAGELRIGATGQANDHVLNQLLRIQRLASSECRARSFAFTALHTGIETEQLIPGEILGLFHTQQGLRVFQVQRLEARRTTSTKALGTAVPSQVQGTGEGMLHRPAPGHAEEQFGYAPEHPKAQQGDQQPTTKTFRQNSGHWQGRDEEACGEHQQAFRQAHPRPF